MTSAPDAEGIARRHGLALIVLLKQVFDRGRRLAGSPRRFAEMKIYAFKRYQDHRRYLELEREHVRRGIRERSS
jgi:hypothetical protein